MKEINYSFDLQSNKNALGKNKYFDPVMGAAGALVMGGIVYYINSRHGVSEASIAALKQGAYTLLMGGCFTKLCENISVHVNRKRLAITSAVVIPAAITIGLTYIVHRLKGTPEPLESTIPTMIAAPSGFTWWANRKRSELESIVKNIKS